MKKAFTLVELLVVITIISILMGLVLGAASGVRDKSYRSRAQVEVQAIENAAERYKTDNGDYPPISDKNGNSSITSSGTIYTYNPSSYQTAAQNLFTLLMGRSSYSGTSTSTAYLELKSSQVGNATGTSTINDPWKNPYGYYYSSNGTVTGAATTTDKSLFNVASPDIWSTGGQNASATVNPANSVYLKWIKNWGAQ